MRHHDSTRKFGREKNGRTALVKGLALSLITHGKMVTTEAKAKEIRPIVEKMVTKAKNPTVANRRLLLAGLYNNELAVTQLVDVVASKYEGRAGGYTRIIKLTPRKGDGSKMAVIEFV